MKIETTFDINQSVWLMHENAVKSKTVYQINIEPITDNCRPKVTYGIGRYSMGKDIEMTVIESKLFITKEELLKSL